MYNTKGRRDATGAFQPEAKRFLKYHKQSFDNLFLIDNKQTRAKMRKQVLKILRSLHCSNPCIAFFCHGYRLGIQFGFCVGHAGSLARAITKLNPVSVVFYSCDVARDRDRSRRDDITDTIGGDGGFADVVRDEFAAAGARWGMNVDGHTTPGHTTRNPFVRRFAVESTDGGRGGYYIVSRKQKKLWSKWRQELKTDFRFMYPILPTTAILDYLEGI
jgi:hypothetical protein